MKIGVVKPSDVTAPILRWVFRAGEMRLTCRVDRQTTGRYALTIIPSGRTLPTAGRITVCESAVEAIRQHAAVAQALRDLGWTLVERTGPASLQPSLTSAIAA